MSFFGFIMVFAENTTPRVFCNIFSVFFVSFPRFAAAPKAKKEPAFRPALLC